MRRLPSFLVPAASICALVLGTSSAVAQIVLVPYGATGYRYALSIDTFAPGGEHVAFDDGDLPTCTAPFGSGNDIAGPGYYPCPSSVYGSTTPWPAYTNLMARLHFMVLGQVAGAEVRFGIDNDVTIYVNGQLVGSASNNSCARYNQYTLPIPEGLLQPGPNLVVAFATNRGDPGAFDMTIVAVGATPVTQSTWGTLKTTYR